MAQRPQTTRTGPSFGVLLLLSALIGASGCAGGGSTGDAANGGSTTGDTAGGGTTGDTSGDGSTSDGSTGGTPGGGTNNGGSTGDGSTGGNTSNAALIPLLTGANATTQLVGTVLDTELTRQLPNGPQAVSGTHHQTSASTAQTLLLFDGMTLRDLSGLSQSGALVGTEGNRARLLSEGTLDQVARLEIDATDGRSLTGYVGIAPGPLPSTGTVNYTGTARAVYFDASQGYDLTNGRASVSADFADRTASAQLDGFTITHQSDGTQAALPFNQLHFKDLTLSGNGYSGASLRLNNGTAQAADQPNAVRVSGQFYGTGADETAGVFTARTAAGAQLFGHFSGD